MKCDELKSYNVVATADVNPEVVDSLGCTEWTGYDKNEVDDAIAELKSENERLNRELEHVKNGDCINTCDVVEKHVKEEIKAKRALWLARAERAHAEWGHWATIWFRDATIKLNINKSSVSQVPYCCTIERNAAIWRNMWREVERKCLAKAEEYK